MGRRIMKVPVEQRDTNFKDMDAIFFATDAAGLRILSFNQPSPNHWRVDYLDTSIAREPKKEECRDEQDYKLRVTAWIRTCTVQSKEYDTFEAMVKGEAKRLKREV